MNEHLDSSETPHHAASIVRWIALGLVVVGVAIWLAFTLFHGTTEEPIAAKPSMSATPPPPPGHYQGPRLAFDYPGDWTEVFPIRGSPWFAAYRPPTSEGRNALVVVAPGPFLNGQEPEQGLFGYFGDKASGSSSITRTNGLPTYSVPLAWVGEHGHSLEGTGMLLVGSGDGTYIATCQYDADPSLSGEKAQVLAACDMLMKTLEEVPLPKIVEPSGCTETELSLIRSIPMPPEVRAGMPYMRQGFCQVTVEVPTELRNEVFNYLQSQLAAAEWDRNPWSSREILLGDRDFDHYVVIVHPGGNHTSRFNIRVGDG